MNPRNKLIKSDRSIFTTKDLGKLFDVSNDDYLYVLLGRLVTGGELTRLSRGVYSKKDKFSEYELANKLVIGSYVSFETVLFDSGIIFQPPLRTVYSASEYSKKKRVGDVNYVYRKINKNILLDPLGVINDGVVLAASKERAACDLVYVLGDCCIDNVGGLNKEALFSIAKIYPKFVYRRLKKYVK